jgi:hypothetical protein
MLANTKTKSRRKFTRSAATLVALTSAATGLAVATPAQAAASIEGAYYAQAYNPDGSAASGTTRYYLYSGGSCYLESGVGQTQTATCEGWYVTDRGGFDVVSRGNSTGVRTLLYFPRPSENGSDIVTGEWYQGESPQYKGTSKLVRR